MSTAEDLFEELQVHLDSGLPFIAYRKPSASQRSIRAFLQRDNTLHITKEFSESGFVFAPFDDQKDAIIIPQEHSAFMEAGDVLSETEDDLELNLLSHVVEPFAKEQHKAMVHLAVEKIEHGALKKVVLSRREEIGIQNTHPLLIFKNLLNKYESAFVYCWYHPKVGLWLGATPETLLEVERNRFKTMSLAGTQKFNGNNDVIWGDKEVEEQQIVTDSILENLKSINLEKISVSSPYTVQAGELLHLKTDITGNINSKFQIPNSKMENGNPGTEAEFGTSTVNLKTLVAAIHPTPAVCGLPREAAKQFILENENYDREFYTGFLGELNLKNEVKRSSNRRNQENQAYAAVVRSSALFVNLRCMKLLESKAYLYVGGGITKDSDPEAEWEETQNKSQTMKAAL